MALDLKMLEMYNLMDYSLLFTVSFNPDFIHHFKSHFIEAEDGELVKPYRLKEPEKYSSENKEKIIHNFLLAMSGLDENQFDQHNFEMSEAVPSKPKIGWSGLQKKIESLAKDKDLQSHLREKYGRTRHEFVSEDGMYIYSVGIIDYLQTFNTEKNLEHLFKELRQRGHSM
jgi:hypothetical protein